MDYKVAVVTEDGRKISSHFGRAPFYRVFSVSDDQIVDEEQRSKAYHGQHAHHEQHPDHLERHHEHQALHGNMLAPVDDCRVLICGGMGDPAYQKAREAGLEVVLAGGEIRPAVEAYIRGELESDMRRVHRH